MIRMELSDQSVQSTYTIYVAVTDAPDIQKWYNERAIIKPKRVKVSYHYPAGGVVVDDWRAQVWGERVLKNGNRGMNMMFDYDPGTAPDWLVELVDHHRPNWKDILQSPWA